MKIIKIFSFALLFTILSVSGGYSQGADDLYPTNIYTALGGDSLVVKAAGKILARTGGTVALDSIVYRGKIASFAIPMPGYPGYSYGVYEEFVIMPTIGIGTGSGFGLRTDYADSQNVNITPYVFMASDSMNSDEYPPVSIDMASGGLRLRLGNADNDSIKFLMNGESWQIDSLLSKELFLSMRVKFPYQIYQTEVKIGLIEKDAAIGNEGKDGIYFTNGDETDSLWAVSSNGGSYDSTIAIGAIDSSKWYLLQLHSDGTGNVQAYVDGSLIGTITTSVPNPTLCFGVIIKQGVAYTLARKQFDIDFIKIDQLK